MSMGVNIEGLSFPVCNKFKRIVKDKQACYSLDLKESLSEVRGKTMQGKGNGLFFAISMEMSTNSESSDTEKELNDVVHFDTRRSTSNKNHGTIHISTLERFSDSRPGMYVMTRVCTFNLPGQTQGKILLRGHQCDRQSSEIALASGNLD